MIFALFIIKGIQYKEFNYKGSYEKYPVHGTYTFELWGAQGGGGYHDGYKESQGGKGAYVYGEASFLSEVNLTIRVGGQGTSSEQGPNRGDSTKFPHFLMFPVKIPAILNFRPE